MVEDQGVRHELVRYAEIVPSLVREVEDGPLGRGWRDAPERLLRFLHYNVYTVPWRSFEILDVLRRHTGRSDLDGLRVLDLGCGAGTMALYLALEGKAETVVGIDRDRSSFGLLNSLLLALNPGRIALVQGDLAHPPVAPHAFDVVLSYDSLYYPGLSRQEALDNAFEVLRPGDALVIKVFNRLFPPFGVVAPPGVRLLIRRPLRSWERSGRSSSLVQPNAPSSLGLVQLLRRRGFREIKAYNRYT